MYRKRKATKVARGRDQVTYKVRPSRIKPDFAMETLKDRMAWTDVLQTQRPQMPPQTTILERLSTVSNGLVPCKYLPASCIGLIKC